VHHPSPTIPIVAIDMRERIQAQPARIRVGRDERANVRDVKDR